MMLAGSFLTWQTKDRLNMSALVALSQYDDDFKAFKTYMLVKPEGRRVGLKTNVLQWDLLD